MTEQKKLKCKTRMIIEVNHRDLNSFVSSVYDCSFNFLDSEEAEMDSSNEFPDINGELDSSEKKKLGWFIANETSSNMTRILLKDLVRKGLIQPGDYLINTW